MNYKEFFKGHTLSQLKLLREAIWVLNGFGFEQDRTMTKALWEELELRERK